MDTILGYCSTKLAKHSQYDSEIIKFAMKLWLSSDWPIICYDVYCLFVF
ncbi:MAG: hypothetical protein V8S74_11040 [Lachnospirales bacterium]